MKKSYLLNQLMLLEENLRGMRTEITSKRKIKGSLLIKNIGNQRYYYHRHDEKDTSGAYITKVHFAFVKQLAQQDYERKVQASAEKAESVIAKCIALLKKCRFPEEVYIEHMGMMDDPSYVAENVQKVREYEDVRIYQGKNLILMFSDFKHPIDSKRVKRMIDRVLV